MSLKRVEWRSLLKQRATERWCCLAIVLLPSREAWNRWILLAGRSVAFTFFRVRLMGLIISNCPFDSGISLTSPELACRQNGVHHPVLNFGRPQVTLKVSATLSLARSLHSSLNLSRLVFSRMGLHLGRRTVPNTLCSMSNARGHSSSRFKAKSNVLR
jgi:hypothetical protein